MTLDELKEKLSTAKNLIYSGEIEKAINDAEKIEKEYWNSIYSSIVYYNLGILYMNIGFWYNKLGFNDKTLEAYKIAESKFDNSNNKEESLKYIECIVTIANIYTSEGNYDWADFYKNKYTDTFTRSKVNIEYQYMLYLSEDFFSGYKKMLEDNFDEALDLISKYNQELRNFIENNPQIVDINLYYNYFYSLACEAYINAYKGDIERALNLYELTVLDYNLTDEDILYIILLNTIFYADLLSELKFNAKSIKYYNKAIDLIKKLSGSDLHKQSKYSCYLAECYSKKGMVLLPDDLENNEKKESFIKVVNYYLTQAIDIFEDFCFQTTDYYKYKHIECLLQKANLLIFTISLKKDPNYKEAIKMLKTAKNLLSNSNLAEEEIKKLNIYINKTESFLYIKLDDKELFENNLKKVLKIADSISNEKEKNYYLADLNNELAAKLLSNNNDMINLYDKTEDYKKALSLLKNNEDFYIKADNKKYLLDFISNSLIINNKFDDNIIEIIQKQIERCQDHYLSDSFISNYYLRNLLLQKEAYQNLNNDNKALEYLIKADKQLDKIKVINQFIKELWIEILEEIIQLTEEDFNPDINQSYYIKKIQKIRKIKIDKDVLVDLNILEENTNSEYNLSSSSLKQLEENKQQAIKDNRIDIARQIQDEIDALYKKN